jgi:hypothetical protein
MRRAMTQATLAVMLLSAACTPAAASPAVPQGIITGRLLIEGGPLGPGGQQPGMRPIPGTIRFTSGLHQRITVRVNNSGRFRLQLPSGRYEVSDRSPALLQAGTDGTGRQTWSRPVPVTATGHHTTRINLTTIVP